MMTVWRIRGNIEFGKRSFSYLAHTVWNDLPLDARLSPHRPYL